MDKAKSALIFDKICQEIGGDWLLVGGTLVQVLYEASRSTEDIDLVQISHSTKSKEATQRELFQFTQKTWGMGPEYVNLAAEFFVKELEGWESEIHLFKQGPQGRIFRPSLTLFCALKLRRASELDLEDVKVAVASEGMAALNYEKLSAWLSTSQLEKLRKLLK